MPEQLLEDKHHRSRVHKDLITPLNALATPLRLSTHPAEEKHHRIIRKVTIFRVILRIIWPKFLRTIWHRCHFLSDR